MKDYPRPYKHTLMWEISVKNLDSAIRRAGMTQNQLAAAVGMKQPSIGRLLSGETKTTRAIDQIAAALNTTTAFLKGETDDPAIPEGYTPVPVSAPALTLKEVAKELGLVGVREIDMNLGMGATYLDVPTTETIRYFDHDWLRTYTRANPESLMFAQGIGDSMEPTIRDSDLILIDCSKKNIAMQSKFWAIAYANCGSIRRLEPLADGGVDMLADNPLVPNRTAYDGEMHVMGRVVAIVRKM